MCHGASAPVPRASRNRDAKVAQPVGDLAQRCDVAPVNADTQLDYVVGQRHATQVGSTLSGAGKTVEQIAATVVECEQEPPWQLSKPGVCAQQGVEARDRRAEIGAAAGQTGLR